MSHVLICPRCNGADRVDDAPCPLCDGDGWVLDAIALAYVDDDAEGEPDGLIRGRLIRGQ